MRDRQRSRSPADRTIPEYDQRFALVLFLDPRKDRVEFRRKLVPLCIVDQLLVDLFLGRGELAFADREIDTGPLAVSHPSREARETVLIPDRIAPGELRVIDTGQALFVHRDTLIIYAYTFDHRLSF